MKKGARKSFPRALNERPLRDAIPPADIQDLDHISQQIRLSNRSQAVLHSFLSSLRPCSADVCKKYGSLGYQVRTADMAPRTARSKSSPVSHLDITEQSSLRLQVE